MMNKNIMTVAAACLMAAMVCGELAVGGTIQIQDGLIVDGSAYGGTESLWIRELAGDGINNSMLRVGFQTGANNSYRAPVRFNFLSSLHGVNLLGVGEYIESARLIMTTDTAFEGAGTVELRTIDSTDQDWFDSQATWTEKQTGLPWVGGGGVGTNYSAIVDTVQWINPGGNSGPTLTPLTFDLTGLALDIVKDWVNGNNTSGGFLLKAEIESGASNAYIDFYSENGAGTNRPMLELTVVPEPLTMVLLGLGGLLIRRRK